VQETLKTKNWQTVATVSTYEKANNLRKELLEKHMEVKIKMGVSADRQTVFRVKCWGPPIVEKKIKKEQEQLKKGKNNRRRQKSSNKTVRGRQKQT